MALLRLDRVSRSYWRGSRELAVLRDASLAVEAGTLISVYGQRNAGKTTLLELAAGFAHPDSGSVSLAGADLATLPERELARVHRDEIGWVEREGPHCADLTVAEYAALPLYRDLGRRRAQRRALAVLEAHDLRDCAGERWTDLCDSLRVRCAIAQALVRGPRLLIADDPTAGLGMIDRNRVCALLRATAERDGIAVLMAVPDMPSMLHAHDVRMLSRGKLIAPSERPERGGATVLGFPGARHSA